MEEMKITGNNTFISVGAVIILLSGIITGAMYVVTIGAMANENHERIIQLEQKRFDVDVRIFDRLNEIDKKVNKINGYLEAQKEFRNQSK